MNQNTVLIEYQTQLRSKKSHVQLTEYKTLLIEIVTLQLMESNMQLIECHTQLIEKITCITE